MEEIIKEAIDRTIGARVRLIESHKLEVGTTDRVLELDYPDPDLVVISNDGQDVFYELGKAATTPDSQVIFHRSYLILGRPKFDRITFRAVTATTMVRYSGFKRVT